jgi:hypothetical protein
MEHAQSTAMASPAAAGSQGSTLEAHPVSRRRVIRIAAFIRNTLSKRDG